MINNVELSSGLQGRIIRLKGSILRNPEVYDPEGVHHQFASLTNHGRKLDLDQIPTDSAAFMNWMAITTEWIGEVYRGENKPDLLLGIANGANRIACAVSEFDEVRAVSGVTTEKVDSRSVRLTSAARLLMRHQEPDFVLITEDVGTTGGTTASVVPELREFGVGRIEVVHTWIRTPELPKLDQLGVGYGALIHEELPTFNEDDCVNLPEGFCSQGYELIPHSSQA